MNRKKIKLFSIILLIVIFLTVGSVSKAGCEIKPGSTVYTSITASDSYQLCYDMRNGDSTLGNCTLDPHLTTNADWGAAAYLGVSVYGSVRSKNGISVTIDGKSYNSTTNNITGVMNMGYNYTQTASLSSGASTNYCITALTNNLNTKYVETLGSNYYDATNKGRAFSETYEWYSSSHCYASQAYPVQIRKGGVLGYDGYRRDNGWHEGCKGYALSDTTFRPVIWN